MKTYICKCGKQIRKSSTAKVTANRLVCNEPQCECFGCPYITQVVRYTSYPENETTYECEACEQLRTVTTTTGFCENKNNGYIYTLDFDFLRKVGAFCEESEHLNNPQFYFNHKQSYNDKGDFTFCVTPTANKAGIAAKMALYEQFFNEDGTRRDTNGADETETVMAQIARGKAQARGEDMETTKIETDVHDTNVPSTAEETEPDNRSTLVASPLDAVSAALAPAFDYSDLDPKTVATLHVAESLIFDARKYYLAECANAVGIAHDALCSPVATQCRNGDGTFDKAKNTFGAWCESVGLNRKTAERFLQVNNLIKSATEEEQAILEQAPKTLLYAAANPNAPTELVEQVKSGDITTNAEYQKLLKEKQELEREKADLASCLLDLDNSLDAANARAEDAEEQKKRFQASSNEANNLAFEKMAELNKLKREMESRPVEVAVEQPSESDIARYRKEGEEAAAAQWQERYESIEAQNLAYRDLIADKNQQLEELASYEIGDEDVEQAVRIILSAETTANTMRAALKLFYDVCKETADADDVDRALYIVQSVYDDFSDAIDHGVWTEGTEDE